MSQHNRPKIPVSKYLSTVFRYYGSAFYVFPPAPPLPKIPDISKHRRPLLPALLLVYPDISTRLPPGVPTPSLGFSLPSSQLQLSTPVLAPDFQLAAPPHPANQQTPSRLGSRLPILEFPGFPAAQILHKIPDITLHRNFVCVS